MKSKFIFLLMFLFIFIECEIVIVYSSNYGEDDTYLGQFVDDYLNDYYVDSTYQIIYNSTLDCMELELLIDTEKVIEDFSTYTEVDTGSNRIQFVNDTYVTHVAHRTEDTYLYYDYGVDFINEYECSFETYLSSGPDYSMGVPFMVSNYINSYWNHFGANEEFASLRFYESSSPDPQHIYLACWNTTYAESDSFHPASEDTWYYINIVQYEKNLTAFIYSDREHENLLDTLSVAHWARGYRYLYALNSFGYTSGSNIAVYWNRNMRIWSMDGYNDGVYYTTELLEGNRALNIMYNASILTDTGITMEFSDDNVTWVNHNDVAGHESLVNGFESIDLRDMNTTSLYCRLNFTSDNIIDTPRMYQLRIVTIVGDIEVGEGGINSASIILAIFLIIVSLSLIYSVRHRR